MKLTNEQLDDLSCSEQYAEFIMERHNVGNGNVLITLMERGDYWEEFLESMGVTEWKHLTNSLKT